MDLRIDANGVTPMPAPTSSTVSNLLKSSEADPNGLTCRWVRGVTFLRRVRARNATQPTHPSTSTLGSFRCKGKPTIFPAFPGSPFAEGSGGFFVDGKSQPRAWAKAVVQSPSTLPDVEEETDEQVRAQGSSRIGIRGREGFT
jgi:hypothetical protein